MVLLNSLGANYVLTGGQESINYLNKCSVRKLNLPEMRRELQKKVGGTARKH